MVFNSNANKVISSFDDLRKISKKHMSSQSKAFNNLESWAQESNNTAIQDVTSKLATLFRKISDDFAKDKAASFQLVSNVFRKFKEYDSEIKNLYKTKVSIQKKEQKYFEDIQKCPSSKNIRDFEIKYNRTKTEREKAEIKLYDFNQEIDSTKSILFKKNMQKLTETLKRHNEAERVLLEAMEKLIVQIPDVSNEEVDDISEIKYKNKEQTDEICTQAKKKLTHLSASSIGLKRVDEQNIEIKIDALNEACVNLVINTRSAEPSPKTQAKTENLRKVKSKSNTKCKAPEIKKTIPNENLLYPRLEAINTEVPPLHPPPTYSDSETFYSTIKTKSVSVLPSAPSFSECESNKSASFRHNTIKSSSNIFRNSPTRMI